MGQKKRKKGGQYRQIKLASWNCGRAYLGKQKKAELAQFLHTKGISICAVSEVDMVNTGVVAESQYSIRGYMHLLPNSWEHSQVARIILYYKKELEDHVKIRRDLMTMNQADVWIEINNKDPLLVGSVYREWTSLDGKKSMHDQVGRLDILLEKLKKALQENKTVIYMGDFNVNLDENKTRPDDQLKKTLMNFMGEHGMSQMIKKTTRKRVVGKVLQESLLDHVYTNNPETIEQIEIKDTSLSDHNMISFAKTCEQTEHMPRSTKKRSYKFYVKEIFNEELGSLDWDKIYNEFDIDKAVEIYTNLIRKTLDRHAPVIKINTNHRPQKVLSTKIKKEMRKREHLFDIYKRNKTPESKEQWAKSRNNVIKMLRTQQDKAETESMSTPRGAWDYINNMRGPKSIRSGPPTKIITEKKEITEKEELADHMNKFFIKKIRNNRESIEKLGKSNTTPEELLSKHIKEGVGNFDIIEVTEKDVKETIKHMRKTKVCGDDDLPNKILVDCKDIISGPLTHIINLSIKTGQFPTSWKVAKTLPLHKKGSKYIDKNFRPISLLSKTSLILEKAIHRQLTVFFTKNKLFHNNQHGYLKGRSCLSALISIYDKWVRAQNTKQITGVLCMDLTSAFDLVDRDILVKKLKLYGAGERITKWVMSYLLGRKQYITIDDAKSSVEMLDWGVPQGSRLGPLLFLIFINDMMGTVNHGSCEMYADDSCISVTGDEIAVIKAQLEENAKQISTWLQVNRLALSPEKSEFMIVGGKRESKIIREEQHKITVEGNEISHKSYIKLLGIILDNDLTFNSYLNGTKDKEYTGLIQTLANRLWLLNRLRKRCTENTCRMLANGIFMGKLLYGLELWAWQNPQTLKQIQILQNKAGRIITGLSWQTPTTEVMERCKWLNIENTIRYQTISTLYKMRLEGQPEYVLNYTMHKRATLSSDIPRHDVIQSWDLQRSFIPRASKDWNLIPKEIRELPPRRFKKGLRKYLNEKQTKGNDLNNGIYSL